VCEKPYARLEQFGQNLRVAMRGAIEGQYLKDKRISIVATYQRLLETHYTVTDGNGKR